MNGAEVHVPKHRSGPPEPRPNLRGGLQQLVESAPRVSAQPDHLAQVYVRSAFDLAALRFYPDVLPGASVPAAGLPWFMVRPRQPDHQLPGVAVRARDGRHHPARPGRPPGEKGR